jgi:hypothetical protein
MRGGFRRHGEEHEGKLVGSRKLAACLKTTLFRGGPELASPNWRSSLSPDEDAVLTTTTPCH